MRSSCPRPCLAVLAAAALVLTVAEAAFLCDFSAPCAQVALMLLVLFALALPIAYGVLSLIDTFLRRRKLAADPLPEDVDVSDREIARDQADALPDGAPLRLLLSAWANGSSGGQVSVLARSQYARDLATAVADGAFLALAAVLALQLAVSEPATNLIAIVGGLLVVIAILARARFLACKAGYVEERLLSKIGADTPAGSADALAKALADISAKTTDSFAKSAADSAKVAADASAAAAKSLEAPVAQLRDGMAKLDKVVGELTDTLSRHKALDAAMGDLAAAKDFRDALQSIRTHLSKTDEALKALSRPRRIRLVEGEPNA
jgi:hypothetical protein